MAAARIRLKVRKLPEEDVLKDVVRLGDAYRDGIPNQTICLVRANGRKARGFVRGWGDTTVGSKPLIGLDAALREKLRLEKDVEYNFQLVPLGWFGQFLWYLDASDPAVRLPALLALLSVILGLVGLLLGVVSMLPRSQIS